MSLLGRSFEDVYSDPGSPLARRTSAGTYILANIEGKRQLLMAGQGASPEGNRPFLDLLDLETKQSRRLWQSSPPYLESVGSIMSDNNDVSCGSGALVTGVLLCDRCTAFMTGVLHE